MVRGRTERQCFARGELPWAVSCPSPRVNRQRRVDERPLGQSRVDESPGPSGTYPPGAGPRHGPYSGTDQAHYPDGRCRAGTNHSPSRPGTGRCGQALRWIITASLA